MVGPVAREHPGFEKDSDRPMIRSEAMVAILMEIRRGAPVPRVWVVFASVGIELSLPALSSA